MDRTPFRILLLTCLLLLPERGNAEPEPGDVYREYVYSNLYGDAGGAIRVGGKQGVSYPDRGTDFGYINSPIRFPHRLDLTDAISAEVVVEKILSHNGTRGLAIQWNAGPWIALPEPESIPEPRANYYHHTCITVPVPLEVLTDQAEGNEFRLRVDPEQDWGWPQHLIYGVHLRIYYDADRKTHADVRLIQPSSGDTVGRRQRLEVAIEDPPRRINRVDYLGLYHGVNWEGDGRYRRWHYFYYHGELTHHLASSVVEPFVASWDTSWVPDQDQPMQVAARVIDDEGLITLSDAVTELTLDRPNLSVEICRPIDTPDNWVTRNGEHQQSVRIEGPLASATAARLVWSSWSPGYMNGLSINGVQVIDTEGPRYRYYDHRVAVPDLSVLRSGINVIRTGKTPLHNGKMVHGMEVNWPGIQLLIQYQRQAGADR